MHNNWGRRRHRSRVRQRVLQKQSSSWKAADEESLSLEALSIVSGFAGKKLAISSSPQEICAHKSNPKSRSEKTTKAKATTDCACWLLKKFMGTQDLKESTV